MIPQLSFVASAVKWIQARAYAKLMLKSHPVWKP